MFLKLNYDVYIVSLIYDIFGKKIRDVINYRELVRMKAACCIRRFIRIAPSYQGHLQDNIRKLLYDKDPGVMSIGVQIHLQLLKVCTYNTSNCSKYALTTQVTVQNMHLQHK